MKSQEITKMDWKTLLEDPATEIEAYYGTPALSYGWLEADGTRMVVLVDDLPDLLNDLTWEDLLCDSEYDAIIKPYVEELKNLIIDEMTYSESFEE